MARDTAPQVQCRREGQKLFLKGERFTDKCGVERRSTRPAVRPRPHAPSSTACGCAGSEDRRYYRVLEKRFAPTRQGPRRTASPARTCCACRVALDNVLVRLGFAAARRRARQLISHGHWLINGRRVDIPSYQVRPEDVISIKSSSSAGDTIRKATELVSTVPAWLQADHDSLTAKVLRYPERAEISAPVQEQLIVELYSK
jgi:small subunit ribosomal protein S4